MESLRQNSSCLTSKRARTPSLAVRGPWHLNARCRDVCLSAQATRAHERVLRYPDGHERRIIYPAMVTLDEDDDDDFTVSWDRSVTGLWTGAGPTPQQSSSMQQALSPWQQAAGSEQSLQDTAAFLEGLFAASYAARPLEDVTGCYEVLRGCPWVLPVPVYVLTSQQWGWQLADGIQSAYTLRTKVVQEGAADAIAQLLNKQHLSLALDVCEMRDGLVMFEAPEDADKFASMLEEEGHSQVMVAEVDSHKVFRMISDLNALAVLLRHGVNIPAPFQLAASLKQQSS